MKANRLLMGLTAMAAMIMTASGQSFLTNGLVAYYPFNGNANDASGHGLNLSVVGATLCPDRFGISNHAYFFNGSSYLISSNLPLVKVDGWTMSAWASPNTLSDSEDVVSVGWDNTDVGDGYAINILGNQFGVIQAGCCRYESGYLLPSAGTWYHLVVTSTNNTRYFYVNGISVGTNSSGNIYTPSLEFTIGSALNCYFFNGAIDDVRIYSNALTSPQVAQLYAVEAQPVLTLTQNLTNTPVLAGQSVSLSVAASGPSPLSYQWYFNGANNVNGVQAGGYAEIIGNFVYGAVVTNGGSGYGSPPSVSFSGGGGSGAAGYASVSNGVVTGIAVTNAGTGYASAPAVGLGAPNGFLYGQTNSTITITNAGANNAGNYYVIVSSASLSITSSIATLTVLFPPGITVNPDGFTNTLHSSNLLEVAATGTEPLAYQWTLNDTNLPGATNSSYTIASLNTNNAGPYAVTVSNLYGNATSTVANAELAPALTAPFAGAVGLWGQNALLNVGAVGSGALNYQWYFNGVPITGATNSSYELDSVQFSNAGLYNVVVSSAYGSVTNTAYQVVVNPANIALGTFPGVYITGTVGYIYTIQSSTNLADTNAWVTLTNLTLDSATEIWPDLGTDTTLPGNPRKFYRVLPGQ